MPALSTQDEITLLRRRIEALEVAIERADTRAASPSRSFVVQTFQKAVYPTSSRSFFACKPCTVSGSEVEGATPTIVPTGGELIVANVGSAVPPAGTQIEAVAVGDRIAMAYDG